MELNKVSVVIRCRNAEHDLVEGLRLLQAQELPTKIKSLEIVLVDNESSDGSVRVAEAYGAKTVNLPMAKFSWGRALNIGIEASSGEIVILLSADAHPTDETWLKEILRPFDDKWMAVVYARQIPRPDAPIDERARLARKFGSAARIFGLKNETYEPTGQGMPYSNACAAIRRAVWQGIPYDEEIEGGEEGIWTTAVLDAGSRCAYTPEARVFHSHRESVGRAAWRLFEIFEKDARLNGRSAGPVRALRAATSIVRRRWRNCVKTKAPTSIRVRDAIRGPIEATLFFVISFAPKTGPGRVRTRTFFWG